MGEVFQAKNVKLRKELGNYIIFMSSLPSILRYKSIMDEENLPTMKEEEECKMIKDFHRNLKGVSKEIMRKSGAVRR